MIRWLTAWRADRLVKKAHRSMHKVMRHEAEGRALRRLAWVRDHVSSPADRLNIEQSLWEIWLQDPDDLLWDLLRQWRAREQDALTAAVDPHLSAAERAGIGEFCVRHDIVPGDPAERVLFFTMTGQHALRRAADPGDSLLGSAYSGSDPHVRAALREELTDAGDLEVIRAVIGSGPRSRDADLNAGDRDSLASQFADRKDWPGLWWLIQDMPLTDAVAAARLVDERWRPAQQWEQDLLGLLARSDPEVIRSAREALTSAAAVHVDTPGRFKTCALSDDGQRLALAVGPRISIYGLPDGDLLRQYRLDHDVAAMLYADDALVTAELSGQGSMLHRYTDDDVREIPFTGDHGSHHSDLLAAHSSGFVARDGGTLSFYDDAGTRLGTHPIGSELGGSFPGIRMSADTGSGLLAVKYRGDVDVLDASDPGNVRLVWNGRLAEHGHIFLYDRDLLFTHGHSGGQLWRLDGSGLTMAAESEHPLDDTPVVYIPGHGEVCCLRNGRVRYLDAHTLAEIDTPRELTGRTGELLLGSPRGTCYALRGAGFVEVITPDGITLQELADRPLAKWQPTDLTRFGSRHASPLTELLRDCLDCRFGSDVTLGTAVVAGDDDIGIA
jgi:hypothetical protein